MYLSIVLMMWQARIQHIGNGWKLLVINRAAVSIPAGKSQIFRPKLETSRMNVHVDGSQ
jgi:hypothetical protein